MKNIILLGATGNIGTQTLNVIKKYPNDFNLIGVACFKNYQRLNEIIKDFPSLKCVYIDSKFKDNVIFDNIASSIEDLIKSNDDALVVNAIGGTNGIKPTFLAIKYHHDIALANKETIVCAGEVLTNDLKYSDVNVIPIDSEHSAIFQCLMGEDIETVNRLIITCSGGPFRGYKLKDLDNVNLEDALKHPNWNMGNKITIDSATLFNKGLEVIEAHYLFGLDYHKIDTIVHKESIVHSLVEFKDGNVKALLSNPNMELPILYALNGTNRDKAYKTNLDLCKLNQLSFEDIDCSTFKAVDLAYKVGEIGGSAPLTYCVANEIAVNAFISGRIKFTEIYDVVEHMCDSIVFEFELDEERVYELINYVESATEDFIKFLKGE